MKAFTLHVISVTIGALIAGMNGRWPAYPARHQAHHLLLMARQGRRITLLNGIAPLRKLLIWLDRASSRQSRRRFAAGCSRNRMDVRFLTMSGGDGRTELVTMRLIHPFSVTRGVCRRRGCKPDPRVQLPLAAFPGERSRKERRGERRADSRIPPAALLLSLTALAISFVAAVPDLSKAEGALAVGIARGGIAKGYATGFAINQPTIKAARSNAVEQCRKTKSSNADAKSGCEVVVTFRNKCVASAVDPQSGTPGAGWGVGITQEAADGQALSRCRAKAGAERADFCVVTDRYCDGK
jgi:hypothetical protein